LINEKLIYEISEMQQEKYFDRIEKMNKRFIIADIIRSICFTIFLVVYIYLYFNTPYLTKNYNNINQNNGQVQNVEEGK
jgi:hypothetical protein